MNVIDIMKRPAAYASGYENIPGEEKNRAKQLCWEYNRTAPKKQQKRREILQELLGTCHPMTGIEPDFHCDYGFNIHTHGLTVINYNCVILDTSPVNIGRVHLSRPASVWPARDTRLNRSSAVRESVLLRRSRWKKMYGSGRMPQSAAV